MKGGIFMIKRISGISACLLFMMAITLSGCKAKEKEVSIYFLNRKPEVIQEWLEIAQAYEEETGVKVRVLTAPNGNHERVLKAEIAKREMPTIFQITGPEEYETVKNYCVDLKDTNLYSWLLEKDMAVSKDGGIYGIPDVVEGYGIIYNQKILDRYFKLEEKGTDYESMSEIDSYEDLKTLTEDMTRLKEKLGIEGVFASTSFEPGEDWRWHTHIMNMPFYYEFMEKENLNPDTIQFIFQNGLKNLFDLYINNSIASIEDLEKTTVQQSMQEFARGSVAMVQNGNWAWNQIVETSDRVVLEEDVKYLPLFIGAEGEENQGICIGTENYVCINSLASKEQQEASIAFLEWLYSSEVGKKYVSEDLGFIAPFETFEENEIPNNPLAREIFQYMNREDKENIPWIFSVFPSQKFKDTLSKNLLEYVKGDLSWKNVVDTTITDWANEKKKEN